jgi:hypothetical protein
MEKHIEALWRRVTDALKPLKKGLVELLGGQEEVKPVPVRVEREVSRHKIEQRRMWSWAALLLCLSACGGPNNPLVIAPDEGLGERPRGSFGLVIPEGSALD